MANRNQRNWSAYGMALKNVSDKYAGQPFAPIKIPPGASFARHGRAQG
jgi:hypothetical protein